MSANQHPAPARGRFVCGLFAAGIGAMLMLVGMGVLPVEPRSGNGPMWIVTAAGSMFLLAGASIAVGAIQGVPESGVLPANTGWWLRLFYYLAGLAIVGGLAIIGSWVAFAPGARNFSGPGLFLLSREANEIFGRVVFGFGATLTWLFLLAFAVSGARKLFSRKNG